jgi:hypothetical protein
MSVADRGRVLVPAKTPGGEPLVVPVVDLDGTAAAEGDQKVGAGLPELTGALKSIKDFSAGLRDALKAAAPDQTTVEFSIGFAMQAGTITAMFVDGTAEGSVTVTMEWGKDQ